MTGSPPHSPAQAAAEAERRAEVLRWFAALFRATAQEGLHTAHHAACLFVIAGQPGLTTHQVATAVGASRAATARYIAALVEAGLVTNAINPQDNRLRVIQTTADGDDKVDAITDASADIALEGDRP